MKLSELLAFAMKNRATELYLAVDMAMEMLVAGEVKRINLPPLQAKDFEELVVQDLGELERESLRTTGRCEKSINVKGLGEFRALVEPNKARIVLPVAPSPAERHSRDSGADRAPGAVPTFSERLRGLFGRKG